MPNYIPTLPLISAPKYYTIDVIMLKNFWCNKILNWTQVFSTKQSEIQVLHIQLYPSKLQMHIFSCTHRPITPNNSCCCTYIMHKHIPLPLNISVLPTSNIFPSQFLRNNKMWFEQSIPYKENMEHKRHPCVCIHLLSLDFFWTKILYKQSYNKTLMTLFYVSFWF
jgi:hypothetical protein